MELKTNGQYNDHSPDMMISSQQFAERKLNCDSSYRCMIGQLDVMIELVRKHPGRDLTTGLDHLLLTMRDHIGSENDVMALAGYPQATKHRLHYQFICINTSELRYRFRKSLNVLSDELAYIRLLLLIHIQRHDQAFEEFLAS